MPRSPHKTGSGNLTRPPKISDKITVFDEVRTRHGYIRQKGRAVSASQRSASSSRSPTKADRSPQKASNLASDPFDIAVPHLDFEVIQIPKKRGKVISASSLASKIYADTMFTDI
jgi:hypothetical protein